MFGSATQKDEMSIKQSLILAAQFMKSKSRKPALLHEPYSQKVSSAIQSKLKVGNNSNFKDFQFHRF
jgi:hypothetical protein